jgi:CHAT domain-containing protein/tetratricopeptide (TPR) repeat protein
MKSWGWAGAILGPLGVLSAGIFLLKSNTMPVEPLAPTPTSAVAPKPVGSLQISDACRDPGTCDPYFSLRQREQSSSLTGAERRRVAARYLDMGLPWRAQELVGGSGSVGAAAAHALELMNEDADDVVSREQGDARVATRIRLLLGIPGLDVSGPFSHTKEVPDEPEEDAQDVGQTSDAVEPEVELVLSPEELAAQRRERLLRNLPIFRPALRALFAGQVRPDVEEAFGVAGVRRDAFHDVPIDGGAEALPRLTSAAQRELDAGRTGPASQALIAMLRAAMAVDAPDEPSEPSRRTQWVVSDLVMSRGTVVVSYGEKDGFEVAALVMHVERGRVRGHAAVASGSQSVSLTNVDGQDGDEVFVRNVWRSDNNTTLQVLYPQRELLQVLASDAGELLNQKVGFIEIDGSAAPEIAVNAASDAGRYGDYTHAPHFRSGYLLAMDVRTGVYRSIGSFRGGPEAWGWGGSGMLVSPLIASANSQRLMRETERSVAAALRDPASARARLALENADAVAGDLRDGGLAEEASTMLSAVFRMAQGARVPLRTLDGTRLGYGRSLVMSGNPEGGYQEMAAVGRDARVRAGPIFASSIALAALQTGRVEEAFRWWTVPAGTKGDNSIAASNKALLLYQVGAWDAASREAQRAIPLAQAEANRRSEGMSMLLVANLAMRQGDAETAVDWLARALRTSGTADEAAIRPLAYRMAATIALDRGWTRLAEALLDNSLYRYDAGTWRDAGSALLLVYGRLFERERNGDYALRAYLAAARLSSALNGVERVQAWAEVGRLQALSGRAAAARDAYRNAFDAVLRGRRQTPTEAFKLQFLQNVDTVAETYLGQLSRSGGSSLELAEATEAWKYKVFSEVYGGGRLDVDQDAVRRLRQRLKPNEAFVSYFIGDHGSFASVVTSAGVHTRRLEVRHRDVTDLRTAIRSFFDTSNATARAYIEARRLPADLDALLDRADRKLVAPLDLPSGIDTLVISPDRELAGLPWAAVHAAPRGWIARLRWWLGFPSVGSLLDRYELALAPSAELALEAIDGRRVQGTPSAALIAAAGGGVSADELARGRTPLAVAPSGVLPPLGQAGREMAAVAGAVGPHLVLSDKVAGDGRGSPTPLTRSNLKALLPRAGMFHFVGHGLFNARSPMQSVLFLDQSAPPGERQLTAADLSALDLHRMRFASLSACESGTSSTEVGAESFGFLRALLASGVHSILLMGWQVDDRASADFYREFYSAGASSRAAAYRQAVRVQKRRYVHPFYWAAGDFYGDWRS